VASPVLAAHLERLSKPGTEYGWAGWSGMVRPLVPDALWAELAPLLPPCRPRPKGGRPPVRDRAALTGILFVLKSGIPWEMLPKEMGCGSGMTCWRRLRDWQMAGVWVQLHRVLLDRLGRANAIDWSRCALDSAAVAAKRGARRQARTQPIAAVRAASVISWSTRTASRSACA
jgi:transposase